MFSGITLNGHGFVDNRKLIPMSSIKVNYMWAGYDATSVRRMAVSFTHC